ncbi:riboflavin synthase [Swaminathania salitolerans]|uniref:Riboflavin synthase n=1 Tax=Swaminathania salitolerans TaxID=182838 RepID=A0A511BPX3_9PROT|nr:riboflavin synthase [Swaminathania salitolerans]GBQ11195.1 riboflavin synthase subunit alpha [Swaminathania salitolerans LMG 21291]GEL02377.1 riboflavin synthase subunit alpha [Swaminathania salitolerans]
MFSGIIDHIGHVRAIETRDQAILLRIATGLSDLDLGESIAVNGVCLTVAAYDSSGLADFYVSSETLARTALGRLVSGARVNLERASTPATRLSGHIVQGHVDGLAQLVSVADVGESHDIVFSLPASLRGYVVEKGSIALDGVSLTVNTVSEVEDGRFTIGLMIIPHTWIHTGLSEIAPGAPANVEVDVLAKYVESLLKYGVRS